MTEPLRGPRHRTLLSITLACAIPGVALAGWNDHAGLDALVAEAVPVVEQITARGFEAVPEVVPITRRRAESILGGDVPVDHTMAFFHEPDASVYVITDEIAVQFRNGTTPEPLHDAIVQCVVAHELTHALQAQEGLLTPNGPPSLEHQAVVEGMASFVGEETCRLLGHEEAAAELVLSRFGPDPGFAPGDQWMPALVRGFGTRLAEQRYRRGGDGGAEALWEMLAELPESPEALVAEAEVQKTWVDVTPILVAAKELAGGEDCEATLDRHPPSAWFRDDLPLHRVAAARTLTLYRAEADCGSQRAMIVVVVLDGLELPYALADDQFKRWSGELVEDGPGWTRVEPAWRLARKLEADTALRAEYTSLEDGVVSTSHDFSAAVGPYFVNGYVVGDKVRWRRVDKAVDRMMEDLQPAVEPVFRAVAPDGAEAGE